MPYLVTGKARSGATDALLFVFTFGIYWWVWLYKAFGEVAHSQRRHNGVAAMVASLAGLWLLMMGASVALGIWSMKRILAGGTEAGPVPVTSPLFVWHEQPLLAGAWAALVIALFAAQLVYVRAATLMLLEATQSAGTVAKARPSPAQAVLFCSLLAFSWVPYVGPLLSLAGLGVAVVWLGNVQGTMNAYWTTLRPTTPRPARPQAAHA